MPKFKRRNIQQNLLIFPLVIFIFLSSCVSKSSDSELIDKINAVQKQMMKQGNISDEERQAFLSLKKIVVENKGFDKSIADTSKGELMIKIIALQKQMTKQENISKQEKQAILSLVSLVSNDDGFDESIRNAIPFDEVENVPVYNGCENLSEEETKKCFKESINNFISTEFDSSLAKGLNVSETQSVDAFFQIDENGEVSNIKVRDANVSIQAEIGRVLRMIPNMKPARQDGKNVPILYSVSVPYGSK